MFCPQKCCKLNFTEEIVGHLHKNVFRSTSNLTCKCCQPDPLYVLCIYSYPLNAYLHYCITNKRHFLDMYNKFCLKNLCEEKKERRTIRNTNQDISINPVLAFSISLVVSVVASACAAVPAGVAQPVNIEWAPTARKISVRVYSSPCARADFQEE